MTAKYFLKTHDINLEDTNKTKTKTKNMKKALGGIKKVANKLLAITVVIIFVVAVASFFVGVCKIAWYGLTS